VTDQDSVVTDPQKQIFTWSTK